MPKRFALAVLGLLLVTAAWAQEAQKPEVCPHPKGWKPTDENLLTWLQQNKNEDLCNVDLSNAKLANADLSGAKLNGAKLSGAELNGVNLTEAKLNGANLIKAKLNSANLTGAEVNRADLIEAELNGANLAGAKLNGSYLSLAKLNRADLIEAKLNNAVLLVAELNNAVLFKANLNSAFLKWAKLSGADLSGADLDNAVLLGADLSGASLNSTSVAGARLANTNLTRASYAPASAPPDPYVAGIQGLSTVNFPPGDETGLVQLRDLLQKAGLRDLEREATFAIERGTTKHSLEGWKENLAGATEGLFRYVAFDLTTAYGLRPTRALLLIAAIWLLLIPMYALAIRQAKRPPSASAIYRIWPKERIEVREHKPTVENPARVERLHERGVAAVGWSAYFSLLSTFQIGFREFSVGTWLSRIQPRNFVLESTGWVRTVSGIQSLLSVYLLAMWVLTYFGRPFQ